MHAVQIHARRCINVPPAEFCDFCAAPESSIVLQHVSVPIIGNETCQKAYENMFKKWNAGKDVICAGEMEGGKDSCHFDSGGPLMCRVDDVWVVSGIVSFGEGCAQPDYPGVYVDVAKYSEWVVETIQREIDDYGEGMNYGDDYLFNYLLENEEIC
jgi:secreted trypsin-like serine protease